MTVWLTKREAARHARVDLAVIEEAIRRRELPTTSDRGYVGIAAAELARWATRRHTAPQAAHGLGGHVRAARPDLPRASAVPP
jgi:hypothetical protein